MTQPLFDVPWGEGALSLFYTLPADLVCSLAAAHSYYAGTLFGDVCAIDEDEQNELIETQLDAAEWRRLCRAVNRPDVADILQEATR